MAERFAHPRRRIPALLTDVSAGVPPSKPRRIAFVLSQQTGGPVDLTVGLALALASRPGSPEIRVIGPEPVTSAGELGELWHPFELPSKYDARSAVRLRRLLGELAPDVVHAQDRRSGLVTAGLRDLVRVTTYHGVPEDVPAAWAAGRGGERPSARSSLVLSADALLARSTHRVFAPSSSIAQMLVRQLRVPARLIDVVPNGVTLPPSRGEFDKVQTLVCVGSLIPRKAFDVALRAFAVARRSHPQLRLRLVGDGPERGRLEELSQQLGVDSVADFVGYREDVPAQLATGEVFLLPSRNENQPLALLEAMGAGLACIATTVGGNAEVMPEGHGLLVAPDHVEGLAAAIVQLAESPSMASQLAARAARRARDQYSVSVCADAHLAAYSRLLFERRSTLRRHL